MSSNYAIIKDQIVLNVIIAENPVLGKLFYPEADFVVEVTEETGPASPNWQFKKGKFIPESPFNGWILDEDLLEWKPPKNPPVVKPDEYFYWDNTDKDWKIAKKPIAETL